MGDVIYVDHSAELAEIIEKQEMMIAELEKQTEILLEMINGFSIVANLLWSIVGIAMTCIAFLIIWRVISRWFFRGV